MAVACTQHASSQHADLVLVGGDVRTMNPKQPRATGVAVKGDKIVAIEDVDAWIGPGTKIIHLNGATVTPGLVDAHCHLYELGTDLEAVDLQGAASEQEAAGRVIAAHGTRGRGWDQNRWPGQAFPTHASIDAIGKPVVLERVDGHAVWLNRAALALAGITAKTADPPGGKIVRDDRGEPTGVLIDNAVGLVKEPEVSDELREKRILTAAKLAIAAGMTGAHEMGIDRKTEAVFERLADEGRLPLRVYAFLRGSPDGPPPAPHGRFTMRGVKFHADGALGSRGARLYEDYEDDRGNRGLWLIEPAKLKAQVEDAVGKGWQVAIHAIGDAGVGSVLDAYAAAEAKHPGDLRLRIEHLQVVAEKDVARVVSTHAIASMQPIHATSDMPWAQQRIGATRILGAYAWRTMLDHHVPLAFGSDFPFDQVGPLPGIYAAVTRQDAAGNPAGGWYPAQRMTIDEAVAAFTRGAAYAEHAEDRRGTIEVGKDADLTVLDRPLSADRSLLETRVQLTVVGGQIVYQSNQR